MGTMIFTRQLQSQAWQNIIGGFKMKAALTQFKFPHQSLASCTSMQKLNPEQSCNDLLNHKKNILQEISKRGVSVQHNHTKHWSAEKALSLVLLSSVPAAMIWPSPVAEYFLALALTVHSHWGVEAIIVDYVRPNLFGKIFPKALLASWFAISVLTFGGLCYFIYTDVGMVNAIKMLWNL